MAEDRTTPQHEGEDLSGRDESSAVSAGPGTPGGEEAELSRLQKEVQEKSQEVQRLTDRLLRAYAELENYKKRAARERGEHLRMAQEEILLEFLPILDNLERALQLARADAAVATEPVAEKFLEGVEMIVRLFQTTLEKRGVTPIAAVGQLFDPAFHQAVQRVESPDGRDNVVVEEVQRGYLFEGKVLRPAMVKVAQVSARHERGE